MKKKEYYIIAFLAFGTLFFLKAIGMSSVYPIRERWFNLVVMILSAYVSYSEISFIKKTSLRIVGFGVIAVLAIGIFFKIMHLPFAGPIVLISGLALLTILIISAINDKTTSFFNYLLIVLFAIYLSRFVGYKREIFFYLEIILFFALSVSAYVAFRKEELKSSN